MTKEDMLRVINENYLNAERLSQAAKARLLETSAMIEDLYDSDDALFIQLLERIQSLVKEYDRVRGILSEMENDFALVLVQSQNDKNEMGRQIDEANNAILYCMMLFDKLVNYNCLPPGLNEEVVCTVLQAGKYCQRYFIQ